MTIHSLTACLRPRALGVAVFTLAVFGLLSGSTPALAGDYSVQLVEGSGEVHVNPTGAPPETVELTSPSYSRYGLFGSLTYSYSETYYFEWVPDDPCDTPVDRGVWIEAVATFDFWPTQMALQQSAAASGSVSVGADAETGSAEAGPNGSGGMYFTEENTGSHTLEQMITLTGESGTFTIEYAGSISTGGYPIQGSFLFANPTLKGPYLVIDRATGVHYYGLMNTPARDEISLVGRWSQPVGGPANADVYRITVEARWLPNALWGTEGSFTPNSSGNWTFAYTDDPPGSGTRLEVRATLTATVGGATVNWLPNGRDTRSVQF